MKTLRELTPDEKARPYAPYYDVPPVSPDAGLLALADIDKPMHPAKALSPDDVNALLAPGYLDVETGWCVLPDGAGYVAMNNRMPGVTAEMVDWWMWWHSLDGLRYMIWFPPSHFDIRVSDEDRARALDPAVPAKQKLYGATHYVAEDVGGGRADITLHFLTPEEMGFDTSSFHRPNVATMVGALITMRPVAAPPDAPSTSVVMCHFIRDIPEGIEYRSRLWIGYGYVDGKFECVLPAGAALPPEVPYGALIHNIEEYCNLRVLLPELYGRFSGTT